MALTAKNLANQELATSIGTIYTVPASTKTRLTELLLCNGAAATRNVTIHFVETPDSPDEGANAFCVDFDLPQGVPVIFPLNTWMEAADTIRGFASGTDCTINISGIEEA